MCMGSNMEHGCWMGWGVGNGYVFERIRSYLESI